MRLTLGPDFEPSEADPLVGMPALIEDRQLAASLFARLYKVDMTGVAHEIDDADYMPMPLCMVQYGPDDWRCPTTFWVGGVARPNLLIGIYDRDDRLLLFGSMPQTYQNGRTMETRERRAIWWAGQRATWAAKVYPTTTVADAFQQRASA